MNYNIEFIFIIFKNQIIISTYKESPIKFTNMFCFVYFEMRECLTN